MRSALIAGLVLAGVLSSCQTSAPHRATVRNAAAPPPNLTALVSPLTDDSFSGYWLDIEKTMSALGVQRYEAHEIQNLMRDELEKASGGFSPLTQRPYLGAALGHAVERVTKNHEIESGFKPLTYADGDFVIALDLDETLLCHWYEEGEKQGTFVSSPRDVVPNSIDKATGDSLPEATIVYSPRRVQIRPGVDEFMRDVAKLPGFRGFIVFTAKDDNAAVGLVRAWRAYRPDFWTNVIAVLTRNHLRYDASVPKPSKDLRIFDESLTHVFLIDDNESRVMQKPLNYMIPKFNADAYLRSLAAGGSREVKVLNEGLMPYITKTLSDCVASSRGVPSPTICFRETLGFDAPTPTQEHELFLAYMAKARGGVLMTLDQANAAKLFEAGFFPGETKAATEAFPLFKKFKIVDGPAILPP